MHGPARDDETDAPILDRARRVLAEWKPSVIGQSPQHGDADNDNGAEDAELPLLLARMAHRIVLPDVKCTLAGSMSDDSLRACMATKSEITCLTDRRAARWSSSTSPPSCATAPFFGQTCSAQEVKLGHGPFC